MANQPNRMSKNLMNSPYYTGYVQGAQKTSANSFNGRPVGQSSVAPIGAKPRGAQAPLAAGNKSRKSGVPSGARPVMAVGGYTPMPQYTEKQIKKMNKQRKRERSHFFVMRRGVCFLMFIVCVLIVAVLALSFLKIMPNFTSIFAIPDNTTQEDRTKWEESQEVVEGEEPISYEDKTIYICADDYIYGIMNNVFKLGMVDEEGISLSANYDAALARLEEKALEEDSMGAIALIAFEYFPIFLIIIAITALITLITSFLGMFGRRIFKCFGLSAIIMLLSAAVVLVAGVANLGNAMGNPSYLEDGTLVSVLDFNNITTFLARLITGFPATAIDPAVDVLPVVFCSGFALLILLAAPIILLILSIFARRKLPYSIFDN